MSRGTLSVQDLVSACGIQHFGMLPRRRSVKEAMYTFCMVPRCTSVQQGTDACDHPFRPHVLIIGSNLMA